MNTEELFENIRTIFANEKADKLPTTRLIEKLPMKISARELANQLKPFGIKSATLRFNGKSAKGYSAYQFSKIFTQQQPANNDPFSLLKLDIRPRRSTQSDPNTNPVVKTGKDVWLVVRSSGIKILRAVLTGLVLLGEQSAQWKEKLND